jgi:hypothetical protein
MLPRSRAPGWRDGTGTDRPIARGELELLDHVTRLEVGHRKGDTVCVDPEGQHPVLGSDLAGYQGKDLERELDRIEVDAKRRGEIGRWKPALETWSVPRYPSWSRGYQRA